MSGTQDWGPVIVLGAAIIPLYGLVIKYMIMDKRFRNRSRISNGSDESNRFVTVDVCEQTQRLFNEKITSVSRDISHVREILTRVERNLEDKHKALKDHIDIKLEQVKSLIRNGKK